MNDSELLHFLSLCPPHRYFPLTRYTEIGIDSQDQVQQYYMFYMHVAIMVRLGGCECELRWCEIVI
jgi:hypothetical protein